ncbi:Macrophage mannose receptor 1, partial [Nibea albiflora]
MEAAGARLTMWNNEEPNNLSGDERCAELSETGLWNDIPCGEGKEFVCYERHQDGTETYVYYSHAMSWVNSQELCRSKHTDLAYVHTEQDNSDIFDLAKTAAGSEGQLHKVWIGLFRDAWVWSDGRESSFRYWLSGAENLGHCAAVSVSQEGRWVGANCNDKASFVCHGAQRLYHFINTPRTWSEAQSFCKENYVDLATVDNMEENMQLIETVGSADVSGIWIGLERSETKWWVWSDGIGEITVYAWGPPEFHGFCVVVKPDTYWFARQCTELLPFMCAASDDELVAGKYIFYNTPLSWRDAESFCRQHHKDLVSVQIPAENAEIFALGQGTNFWIGLFKEDWKWSDRSTTSFRYWERNNPDNNGSVENCAAIRTSLQHQWDDRVCDLSYPFVCHGKPNFRRLVVSVRLSSEVDLNLLTDSHLLLAQFQARLEEHSRTDVKVRWLAQENGQIYRKQHEDEVETGVSSRIIMEQNSTETVVSDSRDEIVLLKQRGSIGYNKAEEWARTAIKRAPNNSYVAETLGQVSKNRLMREPWPLENIVTRAREAFEVFKEVEEKAEREEGPGVPQDTASVVSISNSFNNRGLFGFIQVANLAFEKLNQSKNQDHRSFIQNLQMEVEAKFTFFERYRTYSKPDKTSLEPPYFWKDVVLCYEQYTNNSVAESTSFPGLLDRLNRGRFTSRGRHAGFVEYEETVPDLEEIRDDLKTTYEANVDDVTVAERYILSNIILSNKMPNSLQLTPVRELQAIIHRFLGTEVGRRSPEFYLLALLLFWPEEQPRVVQEDDDEEVEEQASEDDGTEDRTWEDEDSDEEEDTSAQTAQSSLESMVDLDLQQHITFMESAFGRAGYAKYLREPNFRRLVVSVRLSSEVDLNLLTDSHLLLAQFQARLEEHSRTEVKVRWLAQENGQIYRKQHEDEVETGVSSRIIMEQNSTETVVSDSRDEIVLLKQYVQQNRDATNTQLFSFLALMNAYIPESYLLMSECQKILGPPDPIHGGPPF